MKTLRVTGILLLGLIATFLTLFIPARVRDECEFGRVERGLPVNFIDQNLSMIAQYHEYPTWIGLRLPQEYPFNSISYTALVFDVVFWSVCLCYITKLFGQLIRGEF